MKETTLLAGLSGITALIMIAFTVLKLSHVITWSWWWIVTPIWSVFGLYAIWALVLVTILIFATTASKGR